MKTAGTTWAGLDVGKETFDAALYLPLAPGQLSRGVMDLPKASFARSRDGVEKFHQWSFVVRDHAGLEGKNMRIVMEATGRYSLELQQWLNEKIPFTRPAIEDSKTISDFIKSLKLRNKTDRLDAAAIARYGVERNPEPAEELPESYRYLRELIRQRSALDVQLVAARIRLSEMNGFDKLIKIQKSIINAFERAICKLELELKQCINNSDDLRESVEFATSIPGVGQITAATVLAECGPLGRFTSRQLGSYSGLAPQIRQSGKSVSSSRIGKRGPGILRQVLYMASLTGVELNPRMKTFYNRLVHKGKKPLQARCAVMHKLLILIRSTVINKTKYDRNYQPTRMETP